MTTSGNASNPGLGLRLAGLCRKAAPGVLTRYVLREIAAPSVLAFAVVGFVSVGNELRERAKVLPFEFVTWRDMALLMVYFLPTLAYYVIPITYMIGTLFAFGRLADNNEITGMKAAGIPLKRVVFPVVAVGAILSAACFVLQDWAQPLALRQVNDLIFRELPLRATLDVLPTGVMHPFGDWRIYIGHRDPATRTLEDIDILVPQKSGGNWVYHAESAQYVASRGPGQIIMKNAHLIMPERGGHGLSPTLTLTLPPLPEKKIPNSWRKMSMRQMLEECSQMTGSSSMRRLQVALMERISLSLACLAVSLAAAPLAARSLRSGRSYSFAIGFSIMFAYFMLLKELEPETPVSLAQVFARGVAPNAVLGLVGCWALWRVDRV